ncbi:nucleoside 2-deoxyribosyltransferase [Corynebacterium belfantii]|uniref:Nucleoside 2-deoxyribosyltransferase n=2 Tax=Corynebacterium belfantii TaxID=2014537 RepID=A0ABS0LC23_9CORY|nr:nucleoside 2-deoxyribosyltransferase [Corynebacterium belfantii]OWM36841.1 hypothetical protein AZF07_08715 [Corynebacterium diphtheriae subsp. lausannense]QVI97710.1 nucleoside 2-deoxyribosyltransferase [Corynebacterium diphtheriae]MBG9258972.1 nucleoside 2-deoxyribosyltransferase [Corynebacterium belfantii]MBG9265712.1 nucleoside 2-deoxyribosyltransferase [Corynebacterium belfantii]MBG9288160.1 nucleoside 2-deoxyribosyltransferase [Corynebacterium belfantii]
MKIFVAAPFGSKLDAAGTFDLGYRGRLEQLHRRIEAAGHSIFACQRNEEWGHAPLPPEDYVPIDYHELSSSDVIIAVLGADPSLGVCIELGWASALGIPIIVVAKHAHSSTMISGLHRVSEVHYIAADLEESTPTDQELFEQLQVHLPGDTVDEEV